MKTNYTSFAGLLIKGDRESFLSSKYFFRKISIPFSYLLVKIGFSANFVTFLSLIFAILGAFCQSVIDPYYVLASIIFLFVYTILDHCDGEIARYEIKILKMNKGAEGPYFDALVHYFFTPIFYFAIGYAKYLEFGNAIFLWEGVIIGIWLSGFSQASALRVVMDRLLEFNQKISDFESIWLHDKTISRAKFTLKQKIRSIIREIFSTQGQIIIISVLSIFDFFVDTSYSTRFIFLDMMFLLSLVAIPRTALLFFKKLKEINKNGGKIS